MMAAGLHQAWRQSGAAPGIWLLQFFGNLLLIAATAGWLLLPEAHVWQLVITIVVAVAIVVAALWLHAGTLSYFGREAEGMLFKDCFRRAARHLLAFALWALLLAATLWLLNHLFADRLLISGYVRSRMSRGARQHLAPRTVDRWFVGFVYFLLWYLIPALALPFGMQAASRGFSRTAAGIAARSLRHWRYWVVVGIAVLVGAYLPTVILSWKPVSSSLSAETFSFGLRLLLAYLLAIAAWIFTASMLGSISRDLSHSRNDVSGQPAL